MTAPSKSLAKELAAIAARAAAAGNKPTQAAILATYNRNQARAAAKPAQAPDARAAAAAHGQFFGQLAGRGSVTERGAAPAGAGRGTTPQITSPGGRQAPGRGGPVNRAPAQRTAPTSRRPGSPVAPLTPDTRAAMVKNNMRLQRELAKLDRKIGLGPNLAGMANMAKGTPVTAYYALEGALGPKARDAIMEKVYGRPTLEALRRGKGGEAQALATGRIRPPSRRDE